MEASATLNSQTRARQILLSAGGPAIIGALLTIQSGAAATMLGSAELAGIFLGVTLLMAPALYIGAALISLQLEPETILEASAIGLSRAGMVLLGLAPSLLFLHVTSDNVTDVRVWTTVALGIATMAGASAFFPRLTAPEIPMGRGFLFAGWFCVGLGIAGSLYLRTFIH